MTKMIKKISVIILLSIVVLSQMTLFPVAANSLNISASVAGQSEGTLAVEAGDTFSLSIRMRAATLGSFMGGVRFDNTMLRVDGIAGCRKDQSGIWLKKSNGDYDELEAEIKSDGSAVGLYYINFSGDEFSYVEQDFVNITFTTLKTGSTTFTLYERSDGEDGIENSSITAGFTLNIVNDDSVNPNPKFHIHATADKTKVTVGDTVKVTVSTDDMKVSTFAAGIKFDSDVLEYVGYTGFNAAQTGAYLKTAEGGYTKVNVDLGKNGNTVGGFLVNSKNVQYLSGDFFTVELRAIKEGSSVIYLYEDSAGYDEIEQDNVSSGITISSIASTENNIGARLLTADSDDITGEQSVMIGDTFTVAVDLNAATLSSFFGGIRYNKDVLSVQSISGTRFGIDGVFLERADGYYYELDAGNNDSTGVVSFGLINGSNKQYISQTFMKVSFKVVALGSANISLFEDSDGPNGVNIDPIVTDFSVTGINRESPEDGVTVAGNINAPEDRQFIIKLIDNEDGALVTEYGIDTYEICDVLPGEYTLRIEGDKSYIAREYQLVVEENDVGLDLVICKLGDVDMNGEIAAADVTRMARHIAKIQKIDDEYCYKLMDTDKNGEVESADVTHLARYIAKLINTL